MKKERLEEVLGSLEGIQTAKAPRAGFSKIQEKLAKQNQVQLETTQSNNYWIRVAAAIALTICANAWVFMNYSSSEEVQYQSGNDYSSLITDFNIYDYE